jgi:hypothetical protein
MFLHWFWDSIGGITVVREEKLVDVSVKLSAGE